MAERPTLTSLRFWIKAFIPDTSLTPYVYPCPGSSAGLTMIVVDAPLKRCFLGDNRGYSNDPTASARINSLIDVSNLDQLVPTLSVPEIYCGLSTEIDPDTGDVLATDTAPTDRVHFLNLRANTSVDPNGGVIDDSPSPNFVQLDYDAAANLPLLAGSPDIDMFGTLQITGTTRQYGSKARSMASRPLRPMSPSMGARPSPYSRCLRSRRLRLWGMPIEMSMSLFLSRWSKGIFVSCRRT